MEYQPQVLLQRVDSSDNSEPELQIDLEIDPETIEDSRVKDPDYMPSVHIYPTAVKRRSTRLATATVSRPYSPTDPIVVSDESDTDSTPMTISEPTPRIQYVHDSDSSDSDEFTEIQPSPKQIPVNVEPVPTVVNRSRTPSPYPFPLKLHKVALYPRDHEEPYLLEMSHYRKLHAWHIPNCQCKYPDTTKECLADFYHKYGACPIYQATNFLTASPKLIIEHNNVELFHYYINHPELEKFIEAIHYLPQSISTLQSGFAICKMVDSYLILIHIDALCEQTKIGIFATLPIDFRPDDETMLNRTTATFKFLEKELHDAATKVKQFRPAIAPDMERWVSTDEIDYDIHVIRLVS